MVGCTSVVSIAAGTCSLGSDSAQATEVGIVPLREMQMNDLRIIVIYIHIYTCCQ